MKYSARTDSGGSPNHASGGDLAPLRVSLLGRFEVSVGSRVISEGEWRLRKAANLIKLLALAQHHRLHREQVLELLWPDLSPASAANNLHQALHAARRTLEPGATVFRYLQLMGDQLLLCPDGTLWVDVEAFEAAAEEARRIRDPAACRRALELYAADLLPRDRYEEWAEGRREELRRTYLALLLELAALYEERGDPDRAVETLREIVSSEPAHEEAHVSLMRAYARSGRRYHALRQYEQLRQVLRRELGAEPHPASRQAHEEILGGHVPLASSPTARTEPAPRNLPGSLTSFVGREREKEEVERLLATSRLLTLTGVGGCGKTRLAQEIARELAGTYPDGVWFVELASLSDPVLVPQAAADVLSVREQPGVSLSDTLVDALREKDLLLILDNCEHLVDACARLADTLLRFCPRLRILATSREALGVAGEVIQQVPPLSEPPPYPHPPVEDLEGYESVRLFVERSRYRNPAFILTPQNAPAVAEICRRLDGVPLAIELAAARVGFSVEQILARLDDPLRLLTTGPRTATSRQRTLRGALDWSYDLLSQQEKALFRRLSAFAGGFSLEAAEAVGEGIEREQVQDGPVSTLPVFDVLGRLVDKSLVLAGATGAVRYRLLEPVRQYAREKLEESGDLDAVRRRHAALFLALAQEAASELMGERQGYWLERLEIEHDNLRAALSWALESQEGGELALRLVAALGEFWQMRGHLTEGRQWLEAALAQAQSPAPVRAKALAVASYIAWEQGDYERSTALGEECLALARRMGDLAGVADALFNLGSVALFCNEHERASAFFEEAVALRRELGDAAALARTLQPLGLVAVARHDYDRATAVHEENLALSRETGDDLGIVLSLGLGALAALGRGDHDLVRELLKEGTERADQLGFRHAVAFNLHVAAAMAGSQGKPARSARLWGAAEALREEIGTTLSPVELYHYGPYVAAARGRISDAAWEAAWAEGRAMSAQEAVEYALREEGPAGELTSVLTPREEEVATLVARGLTNRHIAGELSISERTVATHVGNALRKLELRSRSQLAARTARQDPPQARD